MAPQEMSRIAALFGSQSPVNGSCVDHWKDARVGLSKALKPGTSLLDTQQASLLDSQQTAAYGEMPAFGTALFLPIDSSFQLHRMGTADQALAHGSHLLVDGPSS